MTKERVVRSALGVDVVGLQPGRCIRLRGGDPCSACEDACPVDLRPWDPEIRESDEWEICTSCGACASVCPTDALVLGDGAWRRLFEAVTTSLSVRDEANSTPLTIACARASDGSEDISVKCLAAFDLSLVTYAWASGARVVRFVDGPCRDCASWSPSGRTRAAEQAERATALAGELDARMSAEFAPAPAVVTAAEEGEHLDRRGFFKWVRSRGISVLGAATEEGMPPGSDIEGETGAGSPSIRRRVAVRAMVELLGQSAVAPTTGRGPISTSVPIIDAETCTGCGDCALFCPVGALRMWDEGDSRHIGLLSDICVGCGLCERLCRFGAITMAAPSIETLTAEPAILVEGVLATCSKCGSAFMLGSVADNDLCPTCARHENRYRGFY